MRSDLFIIGFYWLSLCMKTASLILSKKYQDAHEHLAALDNQAVEDELMEVLKLPRYAFFHIDKGIHIIPEVQNILYAHNAAIVRLGYGALMEQQIKLAKLLLT